MANVLVPISIGELVDKITILKIKLTKITDATKLKNINKEYEALMSVTKELGLEMEAKEVANLLTVNQELWEIEDDIRDKERDREFDDEFIRLARAVYVTNDKRFAAKSAINELFGSDLREEKSYKKY